MIYYKIGYYNGKYLLGGQFLEEWQLKCVKNLVDPYFRMSNLREINVRMKIVYNPSPIKSNLEVQEIEVF